MISFNKKGFMMETIYFLIVALVLGMVTFFGWQSFSNINDDMTDDLELNESIEIINDVEARYPSTFDALFIFVFVGLWVAAIFSALVSEMHPIIFGFMMFIMIFILICSAIFANYFEETFQDAELSSISADFPMTTFAMNHLLEVTIGVVVTVMLALLGKNKVI